MYNNSAILTIFRRITSVMYYIDFVAFLQWWRTGRKEWV